MNPEHREWSEREQAGRVLPPVVRSRPDRPTPRPRRRWGLAAGVAVAVAVTVAVVGPGSGSPARHVPPASAASVELLERAALAAATTPRVEVRAGQYAYVKTVGHTSVLSETASGEMELLREDEGMEQWTSVDGSERTLRRKDGTDTLLPGTPGRGNLNSPTYEFLAALPTDPEVLLERIHKDAEDQHGPGSGSTTGPDQQAFVTIGDLLRGGVTPPGTTAALYRAAALIPGVDTVPDAVDAAGRHGVAVARTHEGERTEWIFDKSTARLLGERTVLVKDSAWGEAGTVVTSVAVVAGGIVDAAGRTP